jgi:hypothetical protein
VIQRRKAKAKAPQTSSRASTRANALSPWDQNTGTDSLRSRSRSCSPHNADDVMPDVEPANLATAIAATAATTAAFEDDAAAEAAATTAAAANPGTTAHVAPLPTPPLFPPNRPSPLRDDYASHHVTVYLTHKSKGLSFDMINFLWCSE